MAQLSRLLSPRSIAVIGGGSWGANVIEECRKIGYQGAIYAVHPKRAEVAGVPAVATIAALPEPPDACFIGVNRDATIEVLKQLREIGAGGAVCFASGFQEAEAELGDGAALQSALLEAAGDLPILGPNCYGMINALDGAALWPDQHGAERVSAGVAILTQSSNIAINLTMQRRGLPIAYLVTLGNQAQIGMSEAARALIEDPRVTALGLHIEGIDDLRGFEALAREAHRAGKPIVALKVGASEESRAATLSHTASLAGSEAGGNALLHRLGIGQVQSLSGLIEALKILHVAGPLPHAGIVSASCSGGEASLMADLGARAGVTYPRLNTRQETQLRAALGPSVALANPLDYHTYIWGDEAAMQAVFAAMMAPEVALGVVVLDLPRDDRCSATAWAPTLRAVAAAQAQTGRPMGVLASMPEGLPEDVAQDLIAQNLIPFCGMAEAMEAIRATAAIHTPADTPLLLPAPLSDGAVLHEAEAKASLETFGLPVPKLAQAATPEEAAHHAADIGFPVVLKATGLAHKSEHGGVALNLMSADAVRTAAKGMAADNRASTGFLVEEMLTGGIAELLVGVQCDPAHGYVLTVAAGGVMTELLQDSASLLIPASRADMTNALDSLRIAPQLRGYRGKPAVDMSAVLDAIEAVQRYVLVCQPEELDINPLICRPLGAVAADALIKTGGQNG